MADRLQQSPLLAGDAIDIAFTIGHNDHPDFGGLELTLRDFKSQKARTAEDTKQESDLRRSRVADKRGRSRPHHIW